MRTRKSSSTVPDREKNWKQIFEALVRLTKTQKEERHLLEDRIKYMCEVINQMKMEKNVESFKAEFMLGLKGREAIIFKHRYENDEDELSDFREWFEYLAQKCSAPASTSRDVSNKGQGSRNNALHEEVAKLKSEIEKCNSEKNSEISSLLAEKNFVWNQYKRMESDFNDKLRNKCNEVEHANEKVHALVKRNEELQFSNERQSEEISRLQKEIELLKPKLGSATPLLRRCRAESVGSQRGGKNSTSAQDAIKLKKELNPSHIIEKTGNTRPSALKSTGGKAPKKQLITKGSSRSSKRKAVEASSSISTRTAVEIITIPDTPKLFSSSFKVPKLKPSSSPQVA